MTAAQAAALWRVSHDEIDRWLAAGMPVVPGTATIDPFTACNWISWQALPRCPLLFRRWRMYLEFARQARDGTLPGGEVQLLRHHSVFLPSGVTHIERWLPRLADDAQQVVTSGQTGEAYHHSASAHPGHAGEVTISLPAQLRRQALRRSISPAVHQLLQHETHAFVQEFRYEYRAHRADEPYHSAALVGSCLDAALALGARLGQRGLTWHLATGIIAHEAMANPHFWLEVEEGQQRIVVDPTFAAIARMLGEDPLPWVQGFLGHVHLGVIRLHSDLATPPQPGAPWLLACIGSAQAQVAGQPHAAWPCLDWICGDCALSLQ